MFGPFRLKLPLGRSYNVDPDDTIRAKRTFKDLGYYKTPKYGLTRYPDESLFAGIESFQRDNGLKRDGIMKPAGETAARLGDVMARREQRDQVPKRGLFSGSTRLDSGSTNKRTGSGNPVAKEKQVAAAAAAIPLILQIPAIAGAIAGMLGLTLPLKGDKRDNDKCDDQLEEDLRRCSRIARGNREIYRRCQKSAMERYGNCIAGRPLGPLDEGY